MLLDLNYHAFISTSVSCMKVSVVPLLVFVKNTEKDELLLRKLSDKNLSHKNIRQTKLTKFWLVDKNFVQQKNFARRKFFL